MKSLQAESEEIVWKRHRLHLKLGRAVGLTNSAFSWKFVYGIMLGPGPIRLETIRIAQMASKQGEPDEHLSDQDPSGYGRLQRGPVGRPHCSGASSENPLRSAPHPRL